MSYEYPVAGAVNCKVGGITPAYNAITFRQGEPYSAPVGNSVAFSAVLPWTYKDYGHLSFVCPLSYDPVVGDGVGHIFLTGSGVSVQGHGCAGLGGILLLGVGSSVQGHGCVGSGALGIVAGVGDSEFIPFKRLSVRKSSPWGASDERQNEDLFPMAATISPHIEDRGAWGASGGLDNGESSPWSRLFARDPANISAWEMFPALFHPTFMLPWWKSVPADRGDKSPWGEYGPVYRNGSGNRWYASLAADELKSGAWRGYYQPAVATNRGQLPAHDAANFNVVGGAIQFFHVGAAGYVPPPGNAIPFQYGVPYKYVPPWYGWTNFTLPSTASFVSKAAGRGITFVESGGDFLWPTGLQQADVIPWGLVVTKDLRDFKIPWDKLAPRNTHDVGTPPGVEPPKESIVIPIKEVYFVLNSLSLTLLATEEPIKVWRVDIRTDNKSWCWSLSAEVPMSELSKISPESGPVEVKATINGIIWKFMVESYSASRTFGKSAIAIQGRSRTALMDSPYASKRSYTYTTDTRAAVVMDTETYRIDPTGQVNIWEIGTEYDTAGWMVLANSLSYANMSPREVISKMMAAAGGYLYSDPAEKIFYAKSGYPLAPWRWWDVGVVPDVILPMSVVRQQGKKWQTGWPYDAVYVSGEKFGVTAHVKKQGTVGNDTMEMVVDPMITDDIIARERGKYELGGSGSRSDLSLSMPLSEGMGGLLAPGLLLEVVPAGDSMTSTWRGLSRGVSISASWDNALRVTQTVEVERHD